jgi:hypothetical protein
VFANYRVEFVFLVQGGERRLYDWNSESCAPPEGYVENFHACERQFPPGSTRDEIWSAPNCRHIWWGLNRTEANILTAQEGDVQGSQVRRELTEDDFYPLFKQLGESRLDYAE